MAEEKKCFVIAPIGEPGSETRKRSDQVLSYVIRPAVEQCGYKAQRADEIDKPGLITSQVIQRVVGDHLVIADLTERNPNVFYELAIRHAIRKPLVQLIRKGEPIPFDVAGTRTIHLDHHDLDSVEAAKNEIVRQIKSLESDSSDLETPISVSLDLQILRQSENPEERSLADLVDAVSDLRTSLSRLELKIGTEDGKGALDEIQEQVRSLPRRIEDYLELSGPFSLRKGRRFHPRMIRDFVRYSSETESAPTGLLIIASLFRDAIPWLYEIGLEAYRTAKTGDVESAREAIRDFRRMVEFTIHGKLGHELLGRSKSAFILMEEIEPLIEELEMISLMKSEKRLGLPEDDEKDA